MKVLVIGGASGLGRALVKIALQRGDDVTVLDSDAGALETWTDQALFAACDVSNSGSVSGALASISSRSPFDLVAITAGISAVGRFEKMETIEMSRVLAVNLTGTMTATEALVSGGMIARGGRLILTSSLSHFVGYPGASAYAASKDGVIAFGKSITAELKGKHAIKVQIAAPGPMDTPHADRHAPPGSRRDRRAKPEAIASSILRRHREGLFVPGMAARLMAGMGRFFPGLAGRVMLGAIYNRLP